MKRKGIILAGGKGTRLYPMTASVSKQLLPLYDKPMIYYSLSVLMLANIREILLISSPESIDQYKNMLGNGDRFGISLEYAIQESPRGLPDAFVVGEHFLNGAPSALILGDNLFYGFGLGAILEEISNQDFGMHIFAIPVKNPEEYGVIALDSNAKVTYLEEKPKTPKTNLAIPGLYFCDGCAPEFAGNLSPSSRGELEIIDLMKTYKNLNKLKARNLGRGVAWLDTGTPDNMMDACSFVATIERRQGLKIGCLEEIAYKKGWVLRKDFEKIIHRYPRSEYKSYLENLF